MMMKTELGDILTAAASAYHGSNVQYRDAMLRTGKLLHDFVWGYLRQADDANEKVRKKNQYTRSEALKIAAARLGVKRADVNRFIAIAMTAELFGGGDLGELTLAGVAFFWRFVRRQTGRRGQNGPGRRGVPISSLETWELKPEFAIEAAKLFHLAVEEKMTWDQIREAVLKLYVGPTARKCPRRPSEAERSAIEELARVSKVASPGDMAAICLQLIAANEEPWAVAQRLMVMVQRFNKKKESMAC
jgi:hypothetical protein